MSEAPLHVHAAPQQTSFPDLLRMLCLAAHHASFFRFEFVYAPTVDRIANDRADVFLLGSRALMA